MHNSGEKAGFDHYMPPALPPEDETLFNEQFLADATPDGGFIDDTRRQFGVSKKVPAPPVAASKGASVDIRAYATAVADIMDAHTHQSKLSGATKVRTVAGNRFDTGYRAKDQNPDAWYEGMREKQDMMDLRSSQAIDTLTAGDALRDAGFDEAVIDATRRHIQREAYNFQPGAATTERRHKEAKRAILLAETVTKQSLPRPKK